MFEILTVAVFLWLMLKGIRLALRITWGVAKIVATVLMVVALPVLIVCMVFLGGIALVIPVVVIAMAVGILKACI